MKKPIVIAILLTLAALGFRLYLALHLPNDEPGDAKLYAQIARNVLEHQVYSSEEEEPFTPTYFRVPGYPLFLAGVYRGFGIDNNRPVRLIQAVIDTLTCWLVGLLALAWSPIAWPIEKRRRALLWALALAAACPFTAIYVTVLLTEVWTMFWVMWCALAATYALKAPRLFRACCWWAIAGASGGLASMFRPDSPLFVAGIGLTLTLIGLFKAGMKWRRQQSANKLSSTPASATAGRKLSTTASLYRPWRRVGRTLRYGATFSLAFCLMLVPWTIRNTRVFKSFMPIAPATASMPGEFAPLGYNTWLRTWVDNWYYTEKADWAMGERPILIEQLPDYAFDSEAEKARVAELLNRYNNPENRPQPAVSKAEENRNAQTGDTASSDDEDSASNDDEDAASTAEDEGDDDSDAEEVEPAAVQMTPELDAEFAEIARQRIASHPLRYYLLTPLKRARHMWFSTHSQYYPFSGDDLFPADGEYHQKFWLPIFKGLVWVYTLLALAAGVLWWRHRRTRLWILLLALLILPRFAYLISLQNPEPRYVVEFFPVILAAAGLALAAFGFRRKA